MLRFDTASVFLPVLSALAISLVAVPGCGSAPAHSETTRTTSVTRPESGGEVHRDATETTEVERDGSTASERTETTRSTFPPE